ncbi:MAG: hypothetical protein M9888_12465 [Chitinophagales bacterium]|nr:hypothetical protein [Chitinophagales bacterium]
MTIITILILGVFACKNSTDKKTVDNETIIDSMVQVDNFSIEKNEVNNEELHNEQVAYIDPTGTYKLDNKTEEKNGEVYGYSGYIQVKKITKDKIVMTFEVNKGAPSYNSGSFVDTLTYKNNIALYTVPDDIDSTCKITFHFDKKGVTVLEETADYNSGCGFGHAVVANGFYKRTSSKTPILTEPLTGEKLEK